MRLTISAGLKKRKILKTKVDMSRNSSGCLPGNQTRQSFPAFYQDFLKPLIEAQRKSKERQDFFIRIAGYEMRLIFNHEGLYSSLTPALKHLRIRPVSSPHLTIYGLDNPSLNTARILIPWSQESLISPRETLYMIKEGLYVSFNKSNRILNLYDENSKSAIFWASDGSDLPFHDKASPFRTILQWFMYKHSRLCVHSAAVSYLGQGILFAGHEMSGKSTTSLLCLLEGMDFAGDDYVAVGGDAGYRAYSLFNSAKLNAEDISLIPELISKVSNQDHMDSEKAVIFLHDYFPARIAEGFPISALLLPKITGTKNSRIKKATPADGIKALAPTTIFLQAGIRKEAFSFLTRFVKRIPSYHLELGKDFEAIPKLIKDFIIQL